MAYITRTRKAGLQRMIDTYVQDCPEWIDVPKHLDDLAQHPDVLRVLGGSLYESRQLTDGEQIVLAIKVVNAARLTLESWVASIDGDPEDVQKFTADNVLAYLLDIPPGFAWLALRNSYGYESSNREYAYGDVFKFIQWAAKNWLPVFIQIRDSPIWEE